MEKILEIRGLDVSYGGRCVLEDFSLDLKPGKITGLLGPNGAGKTTLVKTIIGLKSQKKGTIFLGPQRARPGDVAFVRNLGVVPQDLAICPELSAYENLLFFGSLYGLSGSPLEARCSLLLNQVGLSDRANDLASDFSGGMQRRLNLAVSVVHEPSLVILDEPTVGVDPQSRYQMLELLKVWNRSGMTILYTSHFLDEAEKLCDDLVIMDHGKILAHGSLRDLLAPLPTRVSMMLPPKELESSKVKWNAMDGVCFTGVDGEGRVSLELDPSQNGLKEILELLDQMPEVLKTLEAEKPRLETLFLRLTGRQFRDE